MFYFYPNDPYVVYYSRPEAENLTDLTTTAAGRDSAAQAGAAAVRAALSQGAELSHTAQRASSGT
jgi:hypothetical protein